MSSAAAIRVADHLRPVIFGYVFDQGMSVAKALDELLSVQRVKIPYQVAEALVREEQARRTRRAEARGTARLVDAAATIRQDAMPEFDLPRRGEHRATVVFARGRARVTCACGAQVCSLPRGERRAVEQAWFEHRDGQAEWKK